jgi:site-specific recombinase XerD
MDDYAKYEKACKKIRKANKLLLAEFEEWLKSSGLSAKTIDKHISNADFYVNDFLLYEEAIPARDGVDEISMFLGYWFIRKAMWANPSTIKGNAASLKKFYTFMNEKGLVEKDDLQVLKRTIKEEMPEWLETLRRFDDQSIEDGW